MELVDDNTVKKFTGKLKEILELELKAGNEIVETADCNWPFPNSIMIFLKEPFKMLIQRNLDNIEFRNINDTHFWKAEYFDKITNQYLCCLFKDGPEPDRTPL